MNVKKLVLAGLIGLALAAPAAAQSVARGSNESVEASVGASAITASAIGWVAHAGSEFTVKAIKTTAQGIELTLQGASTAIETSAVITKEAFESAAIGIGTSIKALADGSGYTLVAAGRVIAYVPGEMARALLHRSKR
jgi:hypothetical protein